MNCKGCGTASGVAVADTTPKRRARKVEVMVMDFMVSEGGWVGGIVSWSCWRGYSMDGWIELGGGMRK